MNIRNLYAQIFCNSPTQVDPEIISGDDRGLGRFQGRATGRGFKSEVL